MTGLERPLDMPDNSVSKIPQVALVEVIKSLPTLFTEDWKVIGKFFTITFTYLRGFLRSIVRRRPGIAT